MLSNNLFKTSFVKILIYGIEYIKSFIKAYMLIIVFGLFVTIFAGTDLEQTFFKIISFTPGVGLGKYGNFDIDSNVIVKFFLFWGTTIFIISEVAKAIFKIKIRLEIRQTLLFGLVLHAVSLLVLSIRFGFGFSVVFVGALFTTYLFAFFWVKIIDMFTGFLRNYF
jgi:hypothetical protein